MRSRQPDDVVIAAARGAATIRAVVSLIGVGLMAGVGACANLGALLCEGDCADASSELAGDAGLPGIACGGGSTCDPRSQECCVATGGTTSCTNVSACNGGTDIACDDPRQCHGGACWICINAQGFQGTSCNYAGDIMGQYHCDMTTALPLCRDPSQCAAGKSCKPLPVDVLDTRAGTTWFSACQ